MVHICVPVLKRYDLLRRMLASLRTSTIMPDCVFVIDNGRDEKKCAVAIASSPVRCYVHRVNEPMGVAESWNWFMKNVVQERIIVNDDITFAPDSLRKLLKSDADLIWAENCGFSCYVMRDACIEKVGYFDETISPGYGYYEDEDYLQRLDGRGTRTPSAKSEEVECGVLHLRSQTLAIATTAELDEHHRKFKIAQMNYARKWNLLEQFGYAKVNA